MCGSADKVSDHTLVDLKKVADTDTVGISDSASWLILKDPVAEINKAVNDKDYFKMVAYACSVFEYCGKQILLWDPKQKGKRLSKKEVTELKLEQVIDQLFSRGILKDMNDKSKMHRIRRLRNSFIHRKYSLTLTREIVNKVNASTQDIIDCTELIFDKYKESV